MSITFGIRNDKDASLVEEFDCHYCYGGGCPRCNQMGKVVFKSSRWQINLSNGNAYTLLSGLGLTPEDPEEDYSCGALDGRVILAAIARTHPEVLVRASATEGSITTCGIDSDYVARRLSQLREIAEEAARREEPVVWG